MKSGVCSKLIILFYNEVNYSAYKSAIYHPLHRKYGQLHGLNAVF